MAGQALLSHRDDSERQVPAAVQTAVGTNATLPAAGALAVEREGGPAASLGAAPIGRASIEEITARALGDLARVLPLGGLHGAGHGEAVAWDLLKKE